MTDTHHPTLEDFAFPGACARVLTPRVVVEKPETHARNLLALDLGTATGYALRRRDGSMSYGTEKFPDRKRAHPGQRWTDFRAWLSRKIADEHIHALAYEDVKRHLGTDAAHAYGAFRALVEMVAAQHNVQLLAVGVGTIKKAWTGAGNADKAAMIAEAKRRGFRPDSDNAADALAILHWAAMREAS